MKQPPDSVEMLLTSMPHKLDPHVGAGCKEEPVHWDEEQANHVRCEGNENEEHREGLPKEIVMNNG